MPIPVFTLAADFAARLPGGREFQLRAASVRTTIAATVSAVDGGVSIIQGAE